MKTQKALINFSRSKDHDLAHEAQYIVSKMTENVFFTNPVPSLATVQAAITAYTDALVASNDGSKADTANKNVQRDALESCLSALAGYVNTIAAGDLVKLDSSGFALSKLPSPVGILDAPATLTVDYGKNPGEVSITIGTVERASGYIVLYSPLPAPDDNDEWYSKVFSKSKGTLTHLNSASKYVFKAAATSAEANKMGLYNFSNPVEKLVP